ncbi:MAG: amino-acid N-acetyltransferase [Methylophilaceae bacterium]
MQKIIGNNLRNLRKLHQMSLEALAQKIAMSPGNLSRIERGEVNVSVGLLEKLSQALHCEVSDFFNAASSTSQTFIEQFRQSAKYINQFNQKTFVIALSGEVFTEAQFESIAFDINLLRSLNIQIVIVHGIRPQIDGVLQENHIQSQLVNNVRVTDQASLKHVIDVNGRIRTQIEALLSSSLINSPLFGSDIKISSGNFLTARPLGVLSGVDMQFTGQIRKVDHEAIQNKLNQKEIVLISPLGFSPIGDVFNLSYEQVASQVASAVKAQKLIYYVNADGILNLRGELIPELTTEKAENLIGQIEASTTPQNAPFISYSDFNILKSSLQAIQNKVEKIHLINRHKNGSLIEELFTDEGAGTVLTEYPLETIRPAKLRDIKKIFQLIEPLGQDGVLVERAVVQIEKEIDHYFVMEYDLNLIGCVALYEYDKMIEIACFAIDKHYYNQGYGSKLLNYCEKEARRRQVDTAFILTTQSEHWFLEKGFQLTDKEYMPENRKKIYQAERNSKFLSKKI